MGRCSLVVLLKGKGSALPATAEIQEASDG